MPIINRAKTFTNATHPAAPRVPARKAVADFIVPSASDLVPEIARLEAKSIEISRTVTLDRKEIAILEAEVAADDTPELHPAVAALVDGEPSPKAKKRTRIRELRRSLEVSAAAFEVIAKRRHALQTEADRAIVAAVRPEAERLVGNLVRALETVDAAHQELGDMLLAVEVEGFSTGGLGPVRPHFLSDHREENRRVKSYVKELLGAGYNV